jgi:hypothetical protein
VKGKTLQSQNKEIINNVLTFMEKEPVQGSLCISIEEAQLRAEKATCILHSSIRQIK